MTRPEEQKQPDKPTAPSMTAAIQQLVRALEWYGVDRKQVALHVAPDRFRALSDRISQENNLPLAENLKAFTILGFRFVPEASGK